MDIRDFLLERYFAKHEFSARVLLSPSDCEAMTVQDLIEGADAEVRRLWDGLRLSYTESRGHPLLLAEIARLTGRLPEELVVLNPEEGIFLTLNALLRKGDHVVVLSPCYQSLYEIPTAMGCEVTRWYLKREGGTWSLDLDILEEAVQGNTRAVIVNFPHNPTGFLPTAEEFARVVRVVAERGATLFSDEMYRGLEMDPGRRLPSAPDLSENGVALTGLSKTYGLPGLRLGWLASADRGVIDRVLALKDYTTICTPAPSEVLAIAALRRAEEIVERNRSIVRANLSLARDFFAKKGNMFQWLEPLGGSTAFPRLFGERVEDFCERAVRDHGLMIVPDSVFDVDWNHFRVGMGRKNFPEALAILETIVG